MLEGQEWDSISTALAHGELYTPLVKFSAFSVVFSSPQECAHVPTVPQGSCAGLCLPPQQDGEPCIPNQSEGVFV